MLEIGNYKLGETKDLLQLESSDEHRAVTLAMVRQAQRTLHIFSRDLDPLIYNNADFDQAVSEFLSRSPQTRINVLVQDSNRAVKEGHRLIHLAQRFSSKVEIRKPIAEYAGIRHVFFVADETGYVSRSLAERFEGVAGFDNRLRARDLVIFFNEVWERSQQDSQVRRLYL